LGEKSGTIALVLLGLTAGRQAGTWGPTLQKIVYKTSKSFDFIEITLISSDFTDFKVISLI